MPKSLAKQLTRHGIQWSDPYAGLRPDNWRESLDDPSQLPEHIQTVLSAEATHAQQFDEPDFEHSLVEELKSRMPPAPEGLPTPQDEWLYSWHYEPHADYPCYTRSRNGHSLTTYLDCMALAKGHDYFDLGCVEHSWDHQWLAYTTDTEGNERYQIHVRRIGDTVINATLADAQAGVVWMRDHKSLLYIWLDEESRPREVRRWYFHDNRTETVYAEPDTGWFIDLSETQDGRFALIGAHQHQVSEVRLLDLTTGQLSAPPAERAKGFEYELETHHDRLIIKSNHEREDFALYQASIERPGDWTLLYQPEQGLLSDFAVLDDYLMTLESHEFQPLFKWRLHTQSDWRTLTLDEPIGDLNLVGALESHQNWQRLSFSSPRHPPEVWQLDLDTGQKQILQRQQLPCGHNSDDYVVQRQWAIARDGTKIPLTVFRHRDTTSPAPVLLYGYGAYGLSLEPGFGRHRLSLVDRGIVHVTAHVRGGMEMGYHWYRDGRDKAKTNSFSDFSAALDWCRENIGPKVVIHGGSAGGMLVGATLNQRTDALAGVVADVPFVDVLNTMLDPDLPLTPPEWPEWGNPIEDADAFERIRSYAPYENVKPADYPPVWVTAGLTDPRVTFWEPLKWVARLRDHQMGTAPIVLAMQDNGHGGASGRYGALGEVAQCYRFIIRTLIG